MLGDDAATTYLRASRPVSAELADVPLVAAEGEVPRDLAGVLYRNGPGTDEWQGTRYRHPFDGDGHVVRFAFEAGRVRYTNRFVRTREREEEQRRGRMLYRSFGTNLPGGLRANALRLRFKNAANTSVVHHAGKLLALWEGGVPHRLDPRTLATIGRETFAGRLDNRLSRIEAALAPELPFSAHPKIDPDTGELVGFGTLLGRTPRLVRYRASASGALDAPEIDDLERLVFVHDFVLTKRYAIFFLAPVAFRVLAALSGLLPPAEALTTLDRPTEVRLVPRDGGPVVVLEASASFIFHFAFGHDEPDGSVTVVGMRMPRFPSAALVRAALAGRGSFPHAIPTRFVLSPRGRTVREEALCDEPAELPTVHQPTYARAPDAFFSTCGEAGQRQPFQHRLQVWDVGRARRRAIRDFGHDLPGEPVFALPGYVLSLVYRAAEHRSDLYILDPERLATVARIPLPHHVPPGFHGQWVPQA